MALKVEGTVLRFAGFELDLDRVELNAIGGEAIKLRPKTFALLHLFATNPNRLLTKQELMAAIWPNIHVGEDSLFQCIREIRAALGDEKRQLVKSVSGRGYLFEAQVISVVGEAPHSSRPVGQFSEHRVVEEPASHPSRSWLRWVRRPAIAASLVICFAIGVAVAAPMFMRHLYMQELPAIAVMPIEAETADRASAAMAVNVTAGLTDGLSKISNIRVIAPQANGGSAVQISSSSARPDFVLRGDLQRRPATWEIRARLIDGNTGQVQWSSEYSVPAENLDEALQQSRLTAGIGYPLALQINSLSHARLPSADSKIVVEQASAFINSTTRERHATAQEMLEKALAARPDDVHLGAALAAHLMRGTQMAWTPPGEAEEVEKRARLLLENALRQEPNYIPVLQSYCRFLTATNHFIDSLIACEKALSVQPWDGSVLYQIGLSQLQVGRFEDALVTFQRADTFDTPQVSRWTWLLGVGLALVHLKRHEEAIPWLQRSLAVTPGTGRSHMILAAAYQALGRSDEAKEAVAKSLQLRPGSNAGNIALPTKNQSARYLGSAAAIEMLLVAAGLPER
jgi:DNA-binding winged helix-turn-helix (wHTH) protein/Flp pilus assembly protein TadD/TolB-like protein